MGLQGFIPLFGALYYVKKMERQNNIININCDEPLYEFIEKHQNYKMLKQYLSHCWALELILFYERVSILYLVIAQYQKICTNTNDEEEDAVEHRNKFEFLSEIYEEYESQIGIDETKGNSPKLEDLQLALCRIHKEIYHEFIETGSPNQINISWEMRKKLTAKIQNIDQFQTFHDFLHFFDAEIQEIYRLIQSMYNYEFREYMKSKGGNVENNAV